MVDTSPFDPPVGAMFYALVGVAQLLLAVLILLRHNRREWAWIFAALFVANGGYALSSALRTGLFPSHEAWGSSAGLYFDQLSFLLIAYLALAFPTRPRLLKDKPWVLPIAATALALAVLLLNALHLQGFGAPRSPTSTLNVARLLLGFAVPAGVWTLLLVRWSLLWLAPMTAVVRRQFQFVFAVFAMRAGSQLVLTLPVVERPETLPGLLRAAEALNLLPLLAFFLAMALLAFTQDRQAGTPRSQTFFVLSFMLGGLALGTIGAAFGSVAGYFTNTLNHLDLYVLRPAMIWIAITRHSLLGAWDTEARWGSVLLWVLSLATFADLAAPVSGRLPGLSPLAWTLVLGVVFATVVLLAARPWLMGPPSSLDPALGHGLERYRGALAEAFRNGTPGPRTSRELDRLREWLGVTAEQHAAMVQGLDEASRKASRPFRPGDVVGGRYRVEQLLGEGATGEIHLAHDVLLGEPVVLKRTRKMDAASRRTLLREAEAMARIRSPAVVRLLRTEFVQSEPVLVLEWMQGGSLQTRLAAGRTVPAHEAVRIVLEVLDALQALHSMGIIHGDVKPGNILFDAQGRAKLADFGVVRSSVGLLGDPTAKGAPAGSLRYMAPEAIRGMHTDGRADTYAVAVVLHEMLAGQHPLPPGLQDFEVRKAIVQGLRPRLGKGVPAVLRSAVSRGLAPQPAKRFASASEFAQALRAATNGTPGQSGRRTPRPRSAAARRPLGAGAPN